MKPVENSLRAAGMAAPELGLLILSYAIMPLLLLAGVGIYFSVQQGYWLELIIALSLFSLIPVLARFAVHRKDGSSETEECSKTDEAFVKPAVDWGEGDHKTWEWLNERILKQLSEKSDWSDFYNHSIDLISETATEYGRKEWSFSVPELLTLFEEVSRRYRRVLQQHAPMIEKVPCSSIRFVYQHQKKIGKSVRYGKLAYDVYRGLRVLTPAGLISEIKGQLLSELFSSVGDDLAFNLKKALLQEVASVAIDLYSGRFRFNDHELPPSAAAVADQQRMAPPLDPLRVCVLGQVSAGKSSVINALKKEVAAEVDSLPSTDQVKVYQCSVNGIEIMHLVDLPGLDGTPALEEKLLKQVTQSNIVLWVLKANQPARTLDKAFKKTLDDWYVQPQNRSRKKPVIIGLLNQVDRLQPVAEWCPPYDLTQDNSIKAQVIREAMLFNQELLNLKLLLSLSVGDQRASFNVEALEQQLMDQLAEGYQVQLNQRRIEAGDNIKLKGQLERTGRLVMQALKLALSRCKQ